MPVPPPPQDADHPLGILPIKSIVKVVWSTPVLFVIGKYAEDFVTEMFGVVNELKLNGCPLPWHQEPPLPLRLGQEVIAVRLTTPSAWALGVSESKVGSASKPMIKSRHAVKVWLEKIFKAVDLPVAARNRTSKPGKS
jgi:hypothetical protein